MSSRALMSVREAALWLNISTRLLWDVSAPRGPIPTVRIGGRVLYRVEDLEEYVRQLSAESIRQAEGVQGRPE